MKLAWQIVRLHTMVNTQMLMSLIEKSIWIFLNLMCVLRLLYMYYVVFWGLIVNDMLFVFHQRNVDIMSTIKCQYHVNNQMSISCQQSNVDIMSTMRCYTRTCHCTIERDIWNDHRKLMVSQREVPRFNAQNAFALCCIFYKCVVSYRRMFV